MRPFVLLPALAIALNLFAQTHPPVLENDQVRVLKVTDQPHVKTSMHDHKLNRVMVYLTAGEQTMTPQGGKPTVMHIKAGEVKWSPAAGMHVSEVTGSTPVTIVELEIKKDGDPSKKPSATLDPLKVDPKDYKLEFENSQVRVTRVHMPPHHKVPQHEHTLNRVVVYLTDQNTKMTAADGKVDIAQHKASEASWGTPVKHQEENQSDKPFEALVIEFKN